MNSELPFISKKETIKLLLHAVDNLTPFPNDFQGVTKNALYVDKIQDVILEYINQWDNEENEALE